MKTFQNLNELNLTTFIVRQFLSSTDVDGRKIPEEVEYRIRAEKFVHIFVGENDLLYGFYIGEDLVASVFSPHYVCDIRVDADYDNVGKSLDNLGIDK